MCITNVTTSWFTLKYRFCIFEGIINVEYGNRKTPIFVVGAFVCNANLLLSL